MKNNLIKLIAVFAICVLAVSAFGQMGRGRGASMGGGRPSMTQHAPRGTFGARSGVPMGGGRPPMSMKSPRSSFGQGVNTGPISRAPMGAGRPAYNRPMGNSANISRPSFSAGFRPSLSVHYYGNAYSYHGMSVYWYGGGWYSTYPGGPLIMGNSLMPGYSSAYGYNPYATGYGRPVVVYHNPFMTFLWVLVAIVVIVVLIRMFN